MKNMYFSPEAGEQIALLAKLSAETYIKYKRTPIVRNGIVICDQEGFKGFVLDKSLLERSKGCFVSIYKDSVQRGCMGGFSPYNISIAEHIIRCSISSVCQDCSYEPVSVEEVTYLSYCIDVVTGENSDNNSESILPECIVAACAGYRQGVALQPLDKVMTLDELVETAIKKGDILKSENPLITVYSSVRFVTDHPE